MHSIALPLRNDLLLNYFIDISFKLRLLLLLFLGLVVGDGA